MELPYHKQVVDEDKLFSHLLYKYHPLKNDEINYVLEYLREIFFNHSIGTIEKIEVCLDGINIYAYEKKEQQGENQDGKM